MSSPARNPIPVFSSISAAPAMKVAIPMGMLMKKIQCQLSAWVT